MQNLSQANCQTCHADAEPLSAEILAQWHPQIAEWTVIERDGEQQLQRCFAFTNFKQALVFTNAVGELAEAENHHPALLTEWGKVTVRWWSHSIHGLHLNDLIMAARTDALASAT